MKHVVLQTVYVAGLSHLEDDARHLARAAGVGEKLKLVRDPHNVHDKWAIRVMSHVGGPRYIQIGWVPKRACKLLARLMDGEQELFARVVALHEFGQAIWIDIVWRRPFTEDEKAKKVVTHAKRKRLDVQ